MNSVEATVGTIFIGREYLLEEWLTMFKSIDMPRDRMKLLWVTTEAFRPILEPKFNELKHTFMEAQLVTSPFKVFDRKIEANSKDGFDKKRWSVAFNMNILYENHKGNLFIVEDDTFVPSNSYSRLNSLLRSYPHGNEGIVGAVTGVAYSHHIKNSFCITAWNFIKKPLLPQEQARVISESVPDFDLYTYDIYRIQKPDHLVVEECHASGTFCMLILDECLDNYTAVGYSNLFTGQDVNLGWHITQIIGKKMLVDWSVECKHVTTDNNDNVLIK